jgi:anti-sigma factor RsiW
MSCDEIREQLIDLVYEEEGGLTADSKVREHLRTCAACREEVEELKRTRQYLQLWKDELPLKSVALARREKATVKNAAFRYVRYAAVAAMAFIALLAIANARMSWTKDGFTFSTHLFTPQNEEKDYYTRAEVRKLMNYTNETNYLMIRKMVDTLDQDRWNDIRLMRNQAAKNQN